MREKVIITISFYKREEEMLAKIQMKSKLKRNECFLAMVEQSPALMREYFGSLERGGRYMVDNNIVYREPMRRMLEESTSLSIEEIEKYREIVS